MLALIQSLKKLISTVPAANMDTITLDMIKEAMTIMTKKEDMLTVGMGRIMRVMDMIMRVMDIRMVEKREALQHRGGIKCSRTMLGRLEGLQWECRFRERLFAYFG